MGTSLYCVWGNNLDEMSFIFASRKVRAVERKPKPYLILRGRLMERWKCTNRARFFCFLRGLRRKALPFPLKDSQPIPGTRDIPGTFISPA
jgi:hypothetical protein